MVFLSHLDCAWFYQNEEEIGNAIRDFLKENSEIKREDLFICAKVWNHLHEPEQGVFQEFWLLDSCLTELQSNGASTTV